MKSILFFTLLLTGLTSMAAYPTMSNCVDSNFDNLRSGVTYDQLKYHHRFTQLFDTVSPAPAGFEDHFGKAPDLCYDLSATYLKHNKTGKLYVMYTTHDDYCDGGNTQGVIIDMDLYKQRKLQDAVVAEVGDSEVYCKEKKK